MNAILNELPLLFTVMGLALLIGLLLAPLETLGWWAGWIEGDETDKPMAEPDNKPTEPDNIRGYIVYLTGISGVSGDVFLPEEARFLERMDDALDDYVVVKDVYPYSVRNEALTGQRVFARVWRFALNMKLSGRGVLRSPGFLINLRNLFQVMVSADRRYGPLYNTGFARLIVRTLLHYGYERGSGMPVYLLGYSGGGQIAIGSVPYLKNMLRAPVTVVSLGGALGADPGALDVEHIYHLYGKRDGVQRLAWILSPSRWHLGRWEILPFSRWNQARRQGKMTFLYMGDMRHNGKEGYLDDEHSATGDGRSNMVVTLERITSIVREHDAKYNYPVAA
ncbi:MAG: hypothetical protein AAFV33_26140 [Chloroflexota bacterium]